MAVRTAAVRTVALLAVAAMLAGCGLAASRVSIPPQASSAASAYPPTVADTRRLVVDALARDGLVLADAVQPFRPPESPSLVAAPRGVFQVVLPDDPNHGYIVVYAFRDAAAAAAAGQEQAAYVGSGPGRIQFPPDAQLVIRQVDTTLVFYSWSPANSTDSRAPAIATDLATVGLGVPIAR